MSTFRIVDRLARYGHLPGITLGEAIKLRRGDARLNRAFDTFREIMEQPATVPIEDILEMPRCGCPDNIGGEIDAIGAGGNWKRCHGIGEFHAANINVLNAPPAHLARNGNFRYVIEVVTAAFAEYGLQLFWGGVGSPVQDGRNGFQLTVQFVQTSARWLGLAQVPSIAVGCNTVLWSRYLATWLRNGTDAQIRQGWPILFLHELLHNCRSGHRTPGIMSPTLQSMLAPTWRGDGSEAWIKAYYGGQPLAPDWGIYPGAE